MNLAEVTTLMTYLEANRIDEYVKIAPLKDVILDLLEKTTIEDVIAPILIGDTN